MFAGHSDENAADMFAGHAFGGLNGVSDAGLDRFRRRVATGVRRRAVTADADDFGLRSEARLVVDARDKAGDFRRANVERGGERFILAALSRMSLLRQSGLPRSAPARRSQCGSQFRRPSGLSASTAPFLL
jgi:hypothetical protein